MEPRLNFFGAGPEAMRAMAGLDARVAQAGLEPALVELVRLRVSQLNRCAYCIDAHAAALRRAGEDPRRLALLPAWGETNLFTERERAALDWAEAVTRVAETHVPDAAWERVRTHFTPSEVVDLTLLVASINGWNRFAIAFRKLPT